MRINSIPRQVVSYVLGIYAVVISLLLLAGDAAWGPYAAGHFSSRIDMVQTFKFGPAADVALSPDGRTVALRKDEAIELWNLASQTLVRRIDGTGSLQSSLPGPPGAGTILWSPDGRHLAIGSVSSVFNIIKVIDAATGQLYSSLIPPAPGRSARSDAAFPIAWSPDGRILAIRTTADLNPHGAVQRPVSRLTYWNVDPGPGEPMLLEPDGSTATSPEGEPTLFPYILAWSPDSRTSVTYGKAGGLTCWDVYGGKPLYELAAARPSIADWSANGRTVAYVNEGNGSVRLGDCQTGESGNTLFKSAASPSPGMPGSSGMPTADAVRGLAWSPDGRTLATYATAGIGLWDRSGFLRDSIPAKEIPSRWEYGGYGSLSSAEMQWSRDSKLLTTSEYYNSGGITKVWSVELGAAPATLHTTGSKQVLLSSYPNELLIVYGDRIETWRLVAEAR
jgi:WD40 repeat protein